MLVLILAVLPLAGGYNMYLMRAESPGPTVGKLVPRVKHTARMLYKMYFLMTVVHRGISSGSDDGRHLEGRMMKCLQKRRETALYIYEVLRSISVFFIAYAVIFGLSVLLITLDNLGFTTNA